jgi:hypothetical protein
VEIDDRELVRRVLAGQTDEFRVLVDRHQQSVFRFASGLVGNWEEAQDVTQDAFLAAFANLSGYDSSRALFSTWLPRSAVAPVALLRPTAWVPRPAVAPGADNASPRARQVQIKTGGASRRP